MPSASAVTRAFAITELLENILSCVDDLYQLFVLQRVSRHFRATIQGSTRLRRTVGLAHHKRLADNIAGSTKDSDSNVTHRWTPGEPVFDPKHDPDVLLDEIQPLLYPTNHIQFDVFERGFHSLYEDCLDPVESHAPAIDPLPKSTADQGEMRFWQQGRRRAKEERFPHGFLLRFRFRPGLMGRSLRIGRLGRPGFTREIRNFEATVHQGSYRDVRVALVRKPVEIAVCVLAPWTLCRENGLEDQACYWEVRRYEDGELMLGGVADFLEDVRQRTYAEHWALSRRVEGHVKAVGTTTKDPCAEEEFGEDEDYADRSKDGGKTDQDGHGSNSAIDDDGGDDDDDDDGEGTDVVAPGMVNYRAEVEGENENAV